MTEGGKYDMEYAVPRKSEGSYKLKRSLMVLAYILVPVAIIVLLFSIISYTAFIIVPVFAILSRPLINGTWRYVNYDQRYQVFNAGTVRFTRYYGKKFKTDKNDEHADLKVAEKLILEMKIKDFEVIAPYNDAEWKKKLDESGVKTIINHCSSPSHPNVYYAIFTDEKNGEKKAILFDMIDKSQQIFSYYNRETVIIPLTYAVGTRV
ncbi:MAG: hypothetical protein GX192_01010 [Clostridiales bacterium]|nr:hypothetical protein [Clostridiales bacterium]